MPEPIEAQHDCAAIIATLFDLFRDTRLETSAQAIAWGFVNSFHYEAQKLAREEDTLSRDLGEMARRPDPSEIYASELEELQLRTPAIITPDQLGSLRDLLAEQGERLGFPLLVPEHGEVGHPAFAFEARVCPLALATVSRCFDHDPSTIAVLDEAQFLGRRVRVWRLGRSTDIRIGLASILDNVPELEVANGNAYALLATLGLDPDSVGELPIAELRQRLSDPRVRRRLDDDAQLARYVPILLAMAKAKPTINGLNLAWA